MTGNNILLDTNIVIEFFKGNANVVAQLETKDTLKIPFVVLGELYLGAYRSSNTPKHIDQINGFLDKCDVIAANAETADNYAIIKTQLLKKGKPIPENDIWIAAIAKQNGLILITRDKHFNEINGIKIDAW